MTKAPLTPMDKRWLLNYYCRGIFNKEQIKKIWGWSVEELSPDKIVSEEHYLARCPKCQSNNVAMRRNYGSIGVVSVNAICRECHTYSVGKDYLNAMVLWNKGNVKVTH